MTTNVRFVFDNAADRTSSLTATSTAGSLVPANLQVDERAAVWRSTTLAAQDLDFRWAADETVDSGGGFWSNLTPAATVRMRGYTVEAGDSGLVFDQTVSPDTGLNIGNVTFQNWLAAALNIRHVKITITDAGNPVGYIEISRICIGKRIEPIRNMFQQAFTLGWKEQSKPVRAESRDLRIEPLGRFRSMKLNLGLLEQASRDLIIDMVNNGLGRGVWVSAFPENSTPSTRQLYSFWAALVQDTDFGYPNFDTWSASLVFEEMG